MREHCPMSSMPLTICSPVPRIRRTLSRKLIKEKDLNRIVVAACTPKTHEPLFQETLANAGLNKYLFEMANIRNQDSWVHKDDPEAGDRESKGSGPDGCGESGFDEPPPRGGGDYQPEGSRGRGRHIGNGSGKKLLRTRVPGCPRGEEQKA